MVLGIDPGLATTGYGVLSSENEKVKMVEFGTIKTSPREPTPSRLKVLSEKLRALINKYHPNIVASEKIFFCKNVKTAMVVGESIGVIFLTCANSSIDIVEYTPLEIKQAIVGYGMAEKIQIQKMIQRLLGLKEVPKPDDAADGLAVALTHIYSYKLRKLTREIRTD
jgi:crossover junction endodeoxyribonuclease RuvC